MCSRRKLCSSACLARLNALSVTFNAFLRLGSWGRARSFFHTRSLTSHMSEACLGSWGLAEASRRGALWAARECVCDCLAQDVGERRGHGADVRDTSGEGGVRELGDNLLRYSRPPALIRRQEFPSKGTPWCPSSGLRGRLGAFRLRRRMEAETRRWSDFIFGWTVIFRTSLRSCWRTRM